MPAAPMCGPGRLKRVPAVVSYRGCQFACRLALAALALVSFACAVPMWPQNGYDNQHTGQSPFTVPASSLMGARTIDSTPALRPLSRSWSFSRAIFTCRADSS